MRPGSLAALALHPGRPLQSRQDRPDPRPGDVNELLDRLRRAHDAVLEKIAALEAALAASKPDPIVYTPVRLALSKASRERRIVFAEVCDRFASLPVRQRRALDELKQEDALWTVQSNIHVRTWTREAIEADWEGYRRASAVIRKAMRQRIAREKLVVYPLFRSLPMA